MRPSVRRVSTFVFLAAILSIVCALAVSHGASAQTPAASPQVSADTVAQFLRAYETTPRVTVPVMGGGASVVIVKFTDYQCPACAATHRLYKPVLDKYETQFPGAIKVIVKNYPLDQSCNSALAQTIHPAGCAAAVAATLARAQNQDAAMEDWLYSNQRLLTPESVRKAAEVIGNVKDFQEGYARALSQVKADIGLGALLGVNSTPTFFINGVKIAQVLQPEFIDAAIAYELKRAGKMK